MALFLPAFCPASNFSCGEDAKDLAVWGVDEDSRESVEVSNLSFSISGETLHSLLAAEGDHMPRPDYVTRSLSGSIDLTARQDAINWILKVSEYYRFHPVTTYLAVNYLDRFLSADALPEHLSGFWPMQLLSVACLSAAAKMGETHVPLLLDLQILNPKFIFEPRTVCRMELLLMSTLHWRMRSITPFDFVPYFGSAIRSTAVLSPAFFSRFTDLILRTNRVIDFLRFRPSSIAAAAVLCAASEVADFSAALDASSFSCFHELATKEKVSECRRLMEDFLIDNCPTATGEKTASPGGEPQSPVGVLDAAACASCDTQRSSAFYIPDPDTGDTDLQAAKRQRFHDCLRIGGPDTP